ncbi:MAG: hypothetical protein A2087_12860 [Spirochaetes bacterium GWD1_61_31]|nr:MAG: hypothetical protein A2Y37_02240 [Spirochaetes bacterium GWB1_60_80]OHD35036.1 MAG: hypothetical protein A2004_00850 [Spirochaetes bacterium GWC1_61_12]OHD35647.1 MAG: hypothetical protein A2087_12860 [Spirochaetes bacterium GWD1_61_31]OHD41747.1 MAG: hypothetical protein A2Y35_09110 [Spirochaetes bacterium GWE1_60_18]OHD61606.1 MAG: hypothetical protein A2Y32_01420 [Spirochaetes bacterium GWF1_60_12]HAP44033.1 hypothetical protein [Spirochaetaceae bacterium]
MFRRIMVILLAGLAVFNATAQDTATAPASQLSGSATLGISEQNLLGSPYLADIPGVSASPLTTTVALRYTDGSALSYIDMTQYMDALRRETGLGFEAGIVLDAANLYSYLAPTTKFSSNGDSSWYNLIQPMIDWYENNYARYGLPANPYISGIWPTDNYDGSTTGRTRFIFGQTVVPITHIAWTFTKWYDAQKLFSELKLKIEGAIDAISVQASNGKIIDQYAFQVFTEADKTAARNELAAWTTFHAISDGVNSSGGLTGPNIQSAYLLFTNIAGIIDARFDFAGVRFNAGTLLGATRADQIASGPGLAVALPVGLIPNVNASVAANLSGGVADIVENWETKNSEALPGESSWLGLRLRGGYSIADILTANLTVQWPDLLTRPLTLSANVNATLAGNGFISYQAALEGNFIYWQDRYVPTAASVLAYGGALDARLTVYGATPHALVLYKSAGFWGTGGNNSADRFGGLDLRSDFNAVKVNDALAFDAGVSFNPFLGLQLVSVDGGYRMLMYDLADLTILGQGWYAGVNASLLDLLELPISLAAQVSSYQNWGPYTGIFTDWAAAPTAGLLSQLSWSASLAWEPTKTIRLALEAVGRPSSWRMDSQALVSIGARATIKF